ncbi:MAG: tetrathionate reductase family octaheme c-type cytochrome [Deltaproteobacteria bacterium]|nr:tetrathionate reductase family octaheme c-type cytochrome [Deltaproteobacteria bacterium]
MLYWAAALAGTLAACGGETTNNNTTNNNNSNTEVTCDPTCDADACMVCRIDGTTATCVSACGEGLTCEAGQCVAPEVVTCDPTCDASACMVCQINGNTATCASACGTGLTCEDGQCVAPEVTTCDPTCGDCQVCDTSGAAPVCRAACAEGLLCVDNVCTAPEVNLGCDPACGACQLCDVSSGAPVCVDRCGADEACGANGACVRAGFHSSFEDLAGPFADGPSVTSACVGCHQDEAQSVLHGPHFQWIGATPGVAGHEGDTTIGKRNFINNFCVSVPGNEKRCAQCHAGYDYENAAYNFQDITKVDCLVCHADPASGYTKDPKNAGRPLPTVDLALSAQSVGPTSRANCGSCHFSAGGGDNVKKGDLGSALKNPTRDVDVHMGAGMSCANCHAGADHALLGQGVHNPVSEGRLDCTDCHSDAPHEALAILNEHARDIACQTCHIPAFSRTQATKMNWDWSTSGNKTRGTDGVETTTLADGTVVTAYDAIKGDFIWEKEVKPQLGWHNGNAVHMVMTDTYPAGAGTGPDNPVRIAYPLATIQDADAKIFPFKVMRGKQPGHLTGNYLIAPKLFGPTGFWGLIPAAADYTPEAVRTLWTNSLTQGAVLAGQIASGETIADADWGWVETEMYLGINHEVGPKEMALGHAPCTDCHMNTDFPWADLGYACDPITNPTTCGSRHVGP